MPGVRPTAVADRFYPGDAASLQKTLNELLDEARKNRPAGNETILKNARAIIAPHAGYIYSGPIAASAYVNFQDVNRTGGPIKRILLIGPAHRVRLMGVAAPTFESFDTPLGQIPLDLDFIGLLHQMGDIKYFDDAHNTEHSLEVHLPFIKEVFPAAALVPLTVGHADRRDVARILKRALFSPQTLIIVSSDLSHYQDYNTARRQDLATSQAIEALSPEGISFEDACGRNAINGLLTLARENNLKARTLDLRNSGDTSGDRERVVGYGAFIFEALEKVEENH